MRLLSENDLKQPMINITGNILSTCEINSPTEMMLLLQFQSRGSLFPTLVIWISDDCNSNNPRDLEVNII